MNETKRLIQFHGQLINVLLEKNETPSHTECFLYELPVGSEPVPVHFHDHEEEFFFVFEGSAKFTVNGESFIAQPGQFIPVHRGTPHGFQQHGDTSCKIWVVATGRDSLANYLSDVSNILNGAYSETETREKFFKLFKEYGITIPDF